LETYAGWLGRRAALWHGDVTTGVRERMLREPPDLLLTTPESLEAMLVSAKVDHRRLFAALEAVVVDEVHAFAADDRGWHLLAVLERLSRVAGRPLQRVGLSATVGNPDELLHWLQGSTAGSRAGQVVAPGVDLPKKPTSYPSFTEPGPADPPPGDVQLDYVGTVANAAKVISALHRGEKRLVFCDSRRLVEQLGAALRARGVNTFLSHASLSLDERRRAEQAFAESRNCVIVATSTLELGVDVGDLDRVIQLNAPSSVASFLQRLGRTGRRDGSARNCLFLALDEAPLLSAAGLLLLWGRGWVEPIEPPPDPRHIAAQQILALCLQESRIGQNLWKEWWGGLDPFGPSAQPIVSHLIDAGFLDSDGGMLFIGPEAEKRFGHRHFMGLTSAFTAPPQFTVINGREEIGRTDPVLLTMKSEGPRLFLLAGHSWRVTWIDWKRRRCFVEPAEGGGRARWLTPGISGASFVLSRAVRDVLLGAAPPVRFTHRAETALEQARDRALDTVHPDGTIIARTDEDIRWWTWAGYRANATLKASLSIADQAQRVDDYFIRLRSDLTPRVWEVAVAQARERLCLPDPDDKALDGLKFSDALPRPLAEKTLSARLADVVGATILLDERQRFMFDSGRAL
jgi:ATP-dependent Lhr-like helicase